jgi:hypothetical protein
VASLPERVPRQLIDAIAARLRQDGWHQRPGKDGRRKLEGHCLFHDDQGRPNADFYPDDGWYKCWACDEVYALDEVASALDILLEATQMPRGQHEADPPVMATRAFGSPDYGYHNRFGHPIATYRYFFPDGRLSHVKLRYDTPEGKTFLIAGPEGKFKKPEIIWPVYGLQTLPPGQNYVVVEGEKAQEAINIAAQLHQGVPIFALTCGSSADLKNADNRKTLCQVIADLKPNRVLVWPDNDKVGLDWSKPLHTQLLAQGVRAAHVDLRPLNLPTHAGCDDFLAQDGSLDLVFVKEFQQVGGYTVDDLVEQIVVTRSGMMLMPNTRNLHPVKDDTVEVAIFRVTKDSTPLPKIRQRVRNELRSKAEDSSVEVFYRRWHDQHRDALAWRSFDFGHAYMVDRSGLRGIQDPPHALLVTPRGAQQVSNLVDLDGQRSSLERLCEFFSVESSLEVLECWLLCALVGLQTPILLLRGEAGSGKTTLAKALVGILEPTVPRVQLSHNHNRDERALIGGLRQSMAVVLDNVSSMSSDNEDLLSQFVTGYGVIHRDLYENKVENLAMQRAIVITTTNWNMQKGDLVSRTVAVRMHAYDRFKDEDQVEAFLNPLIEKARGYLFSRAWYYYQQTHINPNGTSSLRLAGFSRVLRALGYDADKIERQLALNRVRVSGETDAWLNAVAGWLEDLNLRVGEQRDVKLEELKGAIEGLTDQFLPSNNKFAAFLSEAAPQFRDLGYTLVRGRTNQLRFWTVKRLYEDEGE